MHKRFIIIGGLLIIAAAAGSYYLVQRPQPSPPAVVKAVHKTAPVEQPVVTPVPSPVVPASFDKTQHSLNSADSLWVVVDKKRPLQPKSYVPANLVVPSVAERVAGTQVSQTMAPALEELFAAAASNATPLRVASGYRSYTYQVNLYNGYVKSQGQSVADTQSARPGYSEHQTGLAADLSPLDGSCSVQQCFATTPAGKWLAANAYQYGFIIRYTAGDTAITGYEYEPWHVRYVGKDLSTELHNQNVNTLERFFDLPDAPNY